MSKVRVATAWLEGCAGCHMSFLDVDEAIVDLAGLLEFGRSPITDVKDFTPVDVGIVEGGVGNTEEEEVLKQLRANCKVLVALGDCACFGAVNAMRNTLDKDEALRRAYVESESTAKGKVPSSPEIPKLLDRVKPLNHIVKVDCFVPGCPPDASVIKYALTELLAGRMPVVPSDVMRFD